MIAGLSLSHTREQLYRAMLESIAFGIRHNIETFRGIGSPVKRVVAMGVGAQSKTRLQIVSDVTGIEQTVPVLTIGASCGDAFLAGLAAGILQRKDLDTWVQPGFQVIPNGESRFLYDHLYENYLNLYTQTRDIVHAFSG